MSDDSFEERRNVEQKLKDKLKENLQLNRQLDSLREQLNIEKNIEEELKEKKAKCRKTESDFRSAKDENLQLQELLKISLNEEENLESEKENLKEKFHKLTAASANVKELGDNKRFLFTEISLYMDSIKDMQVTHCDRRNVVSSFLERMEHLSNEMDLLLEENYQNNSMYYTIAQASHSQSLMSELITVGGINGDSDKESQTDIEYFYPNEKESVKELSSTESQTDMGYSQPTKTVSMKEVCSIDTQTDMEYSQPTEAGIAEEVCNKESQTSMEYSQPIEAGRGVKELYNVESQTEMESCHASRTQLMHVDNRIVKNSFKYENQTDMECSQSTQTSNVKGLSNEKSQSNMKHSQPTVAKLSLHTEEVKIYSWIKQTVGWFLKILRFCANLYFWFLFLNFILQSAEYLIQRSGCFDVRIWKFCREEDGGLCIFRCFLNCLLNSRIPREPPPI